MQLANFIETGRFRRIATEGFWVAVGQIFAVIGSILGVRVLTELMNPAAYGELALGMTVVTLAGQTITGPLSNGAIRFYSPAKESSDLAGYLSAVRNLVFYSSSFIVLLLIFVIVILKAIGQGKLIAVTFAAIAFAILSGNNAIVNGIQNAARQRSIVALHQGIEPWFKILFAAGLMFWIRATSEMAILGYSIAIILILASQMIFFKKIRDKIINKTRNQTNWRNQILRYSWPFAATGIFSWGFYASQRWALEIFTTTEDVGYFSAVFQIGYTPITLAGGFLMALLTPIVFERAGNGLNKDRLILLRNSIIKFCLSFFIIVIIVAVIGAFFHAYIFKLMVAEKYWVVSHFLSWTIIAAGIFQISLFLSTIILSTMNTRLLLPINTLGNLIVVGVNLFFTFLWGIQGLFFALIIGSSIHLAWNSYNVFKVFRNV